MRRLGLALVSLFTLVSIARAQADCDSLRARSVAAEAALRECLRTGASCSTEFEKRDSARSAASGCVATNATPVAVATSSSLALLIEGASFEERDAIVSTARGLVLGRRLLDTGTVRAAREFAGVTTLDAFASEALRRDLEADTLLVIEVRAEGDARFLAFRTYGAGAARPRFTEAKTSTIAAEAARVLGEIFPPPSAPIASPSPLAEAAAPSPTSTPVAIAPAITPVAIAPAITPVAIAPAITPVPASTPRVLPPASPFSGVAIGVDVLASNKRLAAKDWAPLASQAEVGLTATAGPGDSMLSLGFNATHSFASGTANGTPVSTRTWEAGLGPRISLVTLSRWAQPFVEAGPAFVSMTNRAEFESGTQTVSGNGIGAYGGAGVAMPFGRLRAVAGVRYTAVTAAVENRRIAAGGLHVGGGIGVTFGGPSPSR